MTSPPKPIRQIPAKWDEILLVCQKCGKKLGGGFGRKGSSRLDKVLRTALKQQDGARVRVMPVSCLKVCPKGAVTVVKAGTPRHAHLVPAGTDAFETLENLGLRQAAGSSPRAKTAPAFGQQPNARGTRMPSSR